MGEYRKVTISVEQDLADEIARAVASGEYAAEGQLVSEALHHWRRREARQAEVARLRALIDEGFESGNPIEATDEFYEDIKRRGRERLAQRRAAE